MIRLKLKQLFLIGLSLLTFGCNFPGDDAFAAKGGKKDTHSNAPPKTPPNTTPDTTAPTVTITAQPSSLYNSRNITIQFSATDNSTSTLTYQCQVDSGTLAACTTNTSFTVPSTLAEGSHTIRVLVTDAAGNIGTATSSAFTLDVTAPTISALTGPANCTVGSCTNTVAFSTSDALSAPVTTTCSLNGGAATACTSPYVLSLITLNTVGTHSITITARDQATNTSARTHTFTISAATTTPPPTSDSTISAKYKNDINIQNDSAVIFYSGFENDFTGWSSHTTKIIGDATPVTIINSSLTASGGSKYMQTRVTRSQLDIQQYISAQARYQLSTGVDTLYARYYTKIVGQSSRPHHWVRFGAGDYSDGLANTVPEGDKGFWYDLDVDNNGLLSFYIYWHEMRSGRCNNGTAIPGCAGDQGTTYYYGNTFKPANQTPYPRDQWVCIETMTKANTPNEYDGAVAVWMNNKLVGEYKTGTPSGNWLRDNFFTFGTYYNSSTAQPFEGFNFRTASSVLIKKFTLDSYYQKNTLISTAPEEQIIHYDDVVLAKTRIGCKTQ